LDLGPHITHTSAPDGIELRRFAGRIKTEKDAYCPEGER
jgi:hypothetical protein